MRYIAGILKMFSDHRQLFCKNVILIFAFFSFFTISDIQGQDFQHPDDEKINEFILRIQDLYGVDDELINGYPYYPPNKLIASHPYFDHQKWRTGTVYMNGESYQGIPLKYDLTKDAIIIKATLKKDVLKLVHLNSLYVDSVKFGPHLFVHSRNFAENGNERIFYEQVYLNDNPALGYFIHYSKQYLEQYTNIAPQGRFSDTKEKRFLLLNGKTYEVNSRRNFLKAFPKNQRRSVRTFMRKNDIKYRRASNKQINQLMEFCYDQLID